MAFSQISIELLDLGLFAMVEMKILKNPQQQLQLCSAASTFTFTPSSNWATSDFSASCLFTAFSRLTRNCLVVGVLLWLLNRAKAKKGA